MSMGVDHGEGAGDKSPQNLERRIVPPPDFVLLQNFKHQITNVFFASIAGLL